MAVMKKYVTGIVWSNDLGKHLNAINEATNGDFEVVFINNEVSGGILHVTICYWEVVDEESGPRMTGTPPTFGPNVNNDGGI